MAVWNERFPVELGRVENLEAKDGKVLWSSPVKTNCLVDGYKLTVRHLQNDSKITESLIAVDDTTHDYDPLKGYEYFLSTQTTRSSPVSLTRAADRPHPRTDLLV